MDEKIRERERGGGELGHKSIGGMKLKQGENPRKPQKSGLVKTHTNLP